MTQFKGTKDLLSDVAIFGRPVTVAVKATFSKSGKSFNLMVDTRFRILRTVLAYGYCGSIFKISIVFCKYNRFLPDGYRIYLY